jgi:protein TonB
MTLSTDPFADPEERKYVMEEMYSERRKIEELVAKAKALDDEIVQATEQTAPAAVQPEAPKEPVKTEQSDSQPNSAPINAGTESEADSPAIVLTKVNPEYSEQARVAHFNGNVKAVIYIDEHGNIANIRISESPGLGLDEKVIAALKGWRFKAAIKNGVPVASDAVVTMTFRQD